MSKSIREKMKEELKKRAEEQEVINQDSQPKFDSYLTISEGKSQWFPKTTEKEIEHMFDIIPFVAGSKYPTYPNFKKPGVQLTPIKKGTHTYILNLFIHLGIGPQNLRVVCPKENYGLPCPICEERDIKLAQTNVKEERREIYKIYNTQQRVIYNVIVRDGGEEEARGVQVFDYPYNWMEKELQSRKVNKRTGQQKYYMSPDEDGYIIYFKTQKKGDGKYEISGYELLERDYSIADEELDKAAALDELIVLKEYGELADLLKFNKIKKEETTAPRVQLKKRDVEDEIPLTFDQECPYSAEFGSQFDEFEQCNKEDCNVYQDCKLAREQIDKQKDTKKKVTLRPKHKPQYDMGDDVPF